MGANGRTGTIGRRFATLAAAVFFAVAPGTASAGSTTKDVSIAAQAGPFLSYQECMVVRSEYSRYYRIDSSCYQWIGYPLLGSRDWYFLYSSR
jgi:hypothetical protein